MQAEESQTAAVPSRGRPDAAEVALALGGARGRGKGYWMARCPCHDDSTPSLQIWDADDGPAFKCYAGCRDADIRAAVEALGLHGIASMGKVPAPPDRLDHLGRDRTEVVERMRHVYHDEAGQPVARVERVRCADGRKDFRQQRPGPNGGWLNGLQGLEVPLYRLPAVVDARSAGRLLFVVEGEKCADRLASLGLTATTNAMGAGSWRDHHTRQVEGARLVILPDNDGPGKAHAAKVVDAVSKVAALVRVVELPGLPEKGDVVDWLDAGNTKDDLLRLVEAAVSVPSALSAPSEEPRWEAPVSLDEPDLPAFPTSALPACVREWVEEEAEATQTPPDMPALVALSALACACQGKARVRLWDGYEEPLNLYVVVVMPPGSRKSAVVADGTRAIRRFEQELRERLRPEVSQAESRLRRLERRLRLAEEQAARGTTETANHEADGLAVEVSEARESLPVLPRYLADDVTPEKAVQLLIEQRGRLAVFSPEGGIFETMSGRYAGRLPNFDAFLKAHAGDDIRVDRLCRDGGRVASPALTLCLAVQPDVIRSLSDQPCFRGRGLTARFLYSIPRSLVGARKVRAESVSVYAQTEYESAVLRLLAFDPKDAPVRLRLSEEASSAFERFARWVEKQIAPPGELGFMADWGAKLAGATARIAGLLHMAEHSEDPEGAASAQVPVSTVRAAVEIGAYLIPHARAGYGEMGADARLDDARYLWEWFAATARPVLTKQEIWQGTRSRFGTVEPLDRALAALCERGYLREEEAERKSHWGRRPAPNYRVNPLARGQSGAF